MRTFMLLSPVGERAKMKKQFQITDLQNFSLMVEENNTTRHTCLKLFILFFKNSRKQFNRLNLCSRQLDWQPVSLQQFRRVPTAFQTDLL